MSYIACLNNSSNPCTPPQSLYNSGKKKRKRKIKKENRKKKEKKERKKEKEKKKRKKKANKKKRKKKRNKKRKCVVEALWRRTGITGII